MERRCVCGVWGQVRLLCHPGHLHLSGMYGPFILTTELQVDQYQGTNNLFRIANYYSIEGFCYSNGKMIRSIFILKSGVANHFLTGGTGVAQLVARSTPDRCWFESHPQN